MYLVRLQYDKEGLGICLLYSLLYLKHFFVAAGAHDHLFLFPAVASVSAEDGTAALAAVVNDLADFRTVLCDDESQLTGINSVHKLIHCYCKNIIYNHSVNDAVHIAEQDAAHKMIPTSDQKAIFPRERWGLIALTAMITKSEPPVEEFLE